MSVVSWTEKTLNTLSLPDKLKRKRFDADMAKLWAHPYGSAAFERERRRQAKAYEAQNAKGKNNPYVGTVELGSMWHLWQAHLRADSPK